MTAQLLAAIPLAIVASTPLLLAVLGELVVERAGMINLGIEGMMLTAAMTAVVAAQWTHSITIGFLAGIAGAAAIGALFGLFALRFAADQIVTGTAIVLLAQGLTGVVYRELQQSAIFLQPVPRFGVDVIVPLAWIVAPIALGLPHLANTIRPPPSRMRRTAGGGDVKRRFGSDASLDRAGDRERAHRDRRRVPRARALERLC